MTAAGRSAAHWTAACAPKGSRRRSGGALRRRPTQIAAAAATGLVPGVNAWLAGRRRLATVVGIGTACLLGLAALVVHRAGGLLHTIVSPTSMAALAALNLAVLGLRLTELRQLHRSRGPHVLQASPRPPRRRRDRRHSHKVQRIAAALTAAVVILPHLAVTLQLETVRRTVVETFPLPAAAETAPTPEPVPVTYHGEEPRGTPEPGEPTPELPDTADGTIDILLIGLDAGAGRTGARNDANLVVSIDPDTAEVTLIGIPRNLVQIPLPSSEDDCRCYRRPLYSLYEYGHAHPDRYPSAADAGAEAVREAASALLGRAIEWYLVADLAAFQHLVDAVGGIEIDVSEEVRGSWQGPVDLSERIEVDIAPGRHLLDGSAALAYARTRADSDDYRRMARQRCLLAGASETAQDVSAAEAIHLLATTRGELASDIPRTMLPALVDLANEVERERITSIGLVPPDFISGRVDGYPIPDVGKIRQILDGRSSPELAPVDVSSEC